MANTKFLRKANNEFADKIYQVICSNVSSPNVIFSSYCLHTVLGMVGHGGRGQTRSEIFSGLGLIDNKEENAISNEYMALNSTFQVNNSSDTFKLITANRIYGMTGYKLNPKCVAVLKENFDADIELLDFSTGRKCEEAAETINKWVEIKTNDTIKNLVQPNQFNPLTRLVLVNGIYFKGFWEHRFDPEYTFKELFNVSKSKQVEVDMMTRLAEFPVGNIPELEARAVALPYKGGRLSMIVVIPNDISGLGRIKKSIGGILHKGNKLIGETLSMRGKLNVLLPKFIIETSLNNLNEILSQMGIETMFTEDADFGEITGGESNPGLYVSRVIQKAFIEVNEDGTEAAAASFVEIRYRSMPPNPPFVVDRPFYFEIVDHANDDMVLFSGHCADPTQ